MVKVLVALAIVGAIAVAAIVLAGDDDDDALAAGDVPAEARGAYFVGFEFAGLPLEEILVPPNSAGQSISFIYGDCDPAGSDGGCATPLEIQTWGLCRRFPEAAAASRLTGLNGAQLRSIPGGNEVYTGTKAVVIFADGDLRDRAVDQLRPAGTEARLPDLPPVDRRALRGCG